MDVLDRFARLNHGLVTLVDARAAGMSRSAWYRAIDDGRLELLHPGVARMFGSAATTEQRIAAAVLAAGPGALASHRSAARLWGVERPDDDPVDVLLPCRTREASPAGAVVHRPRDRLDLRPVVRRRIATTNILRWACDLGAVDPAGVDQAVGHILTNNLAPAGALYAAVRTHSRRGRPGVPALRRALEEWLVDGRPLDSELERKMYRVARRYGLPPMSFHEVIGGHEVDFRVIGTPVVLECDGWDFHDKRRASFEHDRRRDAELVALGFVVIRFTWVMLTRQPQWVATMVKQAIARWTATPPR